MGKPRSLDVGTLTAAQLARFWAKVADVNSEGCRLWTACRDARGDGLIRIGRVRYQAHRVAWMLANPGVQAGDIRQTCNRSLCCESTHLIPVVGLSAQERHRRWRDANREHVRATGRATERRRRAANPEKVRAYGRKQDRKRYVNNPDRRASVIARVAAWSKANPDRAREHAVIGTNNRRKRKGSGRVTAGQWREIKESFDHRCAYCLRRGFLTMDHVIPLARGGPHEADNIVPACRSCNGRKWAHGPLAMLSRQTAAFGFW